LLLNGRMTLKTVLQGVLKKLRGRRGGHGQHTDQSTEKVLTVGKQVKKTGSFSYKEGILNLATRLIR